jgi:hypothetical protein
MQLDGVDSIASSLYSMLLGAPLQQIGTNIIFLNENWIQGEWCIITEWPALNLKTWGLLPGHLPLSKIFLTCLRKSIWTHKTRILCEYACLLVVGHDHV